MALATTSPWRAGIDANYACAAPTQGSLGTSPALFLSCTQRLGGWPHFALVSVINGQAYEADGVLPALPPTERAVEILAGVLTPAAAAAALPSDAMAQQLAATAFSSGDISHYQELMAFGNQANQEQDFSAAVIAYRAALALQQDKLGAGNPGAVEPLLELALNLSDEAQYPQAAGLFAQAAALTPISPDPTAPAKLLHYEALDQLNQGNDEAALDLLKKANTAYAALLPAEMLQPAPVTQTNAALFTLTRTRCSA
jgi:hypothetical protein